MLKTEKGFLQGEDEDVFLAEMKENEDEEVIEDTEAPFRYIWWNRRKQTFTIFCEGDVDVDTYDNDEDVETYLSMLRAFHKNDEIGRS